MHFSGVRGEGKRVCRSLRVYHKTQNQELEGKHKTTLWPSPRTLDKDTAERKKEIDTRVLALKP